MKTINAAILCIICLIILSYFNFRDPIYCIVSKSPYPEYNGYYVAIGGIYIKRGFYLTYLPDLFDLYASRRTWSKESSFITIDKKHGWTLRSFDETQPVYINNPRTEEYIFYPPPTNWKNIDGSISNLQVTQCVGSLDDSPPSPQLTQGKPTRSNMEEILNRPVTSSICFILLIIAYYLWSNRVEVSRVAFIYENIVNHGEYWRIFTSSLSHFDVLHIGFNTMALYSLGSLEEVYGSLTFGYLNIGLMILTMIICVGLYHILITKFNQVHLLIQPAVGYSCVLFAWMVAVSVRMEQYCPLFFYPSLCFSTFQLPIPLLSLSLPINFGPFILLIVTKIILPKSSLVGHLSGVLIGYPLAWNFLNWLKPSSQSLLSMLIIMIIKKLFIWNFPGYSLDRTALDTSMLSASSSSSSVTLNNCVFSLKCVLIVEIIVVIVMVYYVGVTMDIFPRLLQIFFLWGDIMVIKIYQLTNILDVKLDCIMLLLMGMCHHGILMLTDLATISALASSAQFLLASGVDTLFYHSGIIVIALVVVLEIVMMVITVIILQQLSEAKQHLLTLGLDHDSCQDFLKFFNIPCTPSNSQQTPVAIATSSTPRYARREERKVVAADEDVEGDIELNAKEDDSLLSSKSTEKKSNSSSSKKSYGNNKRNPLSF